MESVNERSRLLGSHGGVSNNGTVVGVARANAESQEYESDDDQSLDIDELTLDRMMARFGTSVGSLGLGGAIQGVPLMRRGSISADSIPIMRRYSRPNAEDLPYGARRKSIGIASVHEYEGRRPSLRPESVDESVSTAEGGGDDHTRGSRTEKYLGGVSTARFWAVFASILLVYFVSYYQAYKSFNLLTLTSRLLVLIPP